MTDLTPSDPPDDRVSLLQRLETLCDEFESDWRAGLRPLLKDYMAPVSTDLRRRLFTELLALDVAYRREAGEYPAIHDYLSEFRDLEDLIRGQLTSPVESVRLPRAQEISTVPGPVYPAKKPALPFFFDDYELLEEVARGGMGVVYRARQVSLDRIVAVKLIRSDGPEFADLVDRFRVERRAAAALRHPGIVAIYAAGEVAGQHFYSMEYVDGETLSSMARQGCSGVEAARIVRDAARAVDYAHQRGVLHRDLKPSNIMLDHDGCVKITDFGLAKQIANNNELTTTGQILGTPSFMSPEQALGDREVINAQSDIYSLGAVLYALLTGRPPHERKTVGMTLLAVMHDTLQKPRVINPAIDEDLERICIKCLEKQPNIRFSTAGELASALDQYLERIQREHPAGGIHVQSKGNAARGGGYRGIRFAAALGVVVIGVFAISRGLNSNQRVIARPESSIAHPREHSAANPTLTTAPSVLESSPPTSEAHTADTTTVTDENVADAMLAIRAALSSSPVESTVPAPAPQPTAQTPVQETSVPPRAVAPFTRAHARQYQEAWAQYLHTSVEISGSLDQKLILIPPGEFLMGITDEQTEAVIHSAMRLGLTEEAARLDFGDAQPQHRVILAQPYWMSATEVTVAQYKTFADTAKYQSVLERLFAENPMAQEKRPIGSNNTWREFGSKFGKSSPVVAIAWNDAVAFCNWLSKREGFNPCYSTVTSEVSAEPIPHQNGYRLPTEAEWEFACRAGTATPHSAGVSWKELADVAWFAQEWNSGPRGVGQGHPNPFGVYDLHGNVFEWCQDRYDPTWYERSPVKNPDNQISGSLGVMRGGDWFYHDLSAHSSARTRSPRASASYHAGFRIVRSMPSAP